MTWQASLFRNCIYLLSKILPFPFILARKKQQSSKTPIKKPAVSKCSFYKCVSSYTFSLFYFLYCSCSMFFNLLFLFHMLTSMFFPHCLFHFASTYMHFGFLFDSIFKSLRCYHYITGEPDKISLKEPNMRCLFDAHEVFEKRYYRKTLPTPTALGNGAISTGR